MSCDILNMTESILLIHSLQIGNYIMDVGNQTEVLDDFNPEALNVTFETNLTAGNLSTLSKGMKVGFFVLFEILANPISFGISLFEKYGVDSQRRTAINMLYSKVAIANVFKNTLALPFAIFGYIINPEGLNGWLALWSLGFVFFVNLFGVYCFIEIMILKISYALKWSSMALTG